MAMAVETWGLTRYYRKNIKALDNLYLRIPEGESFALLGPPGAGKSTLFRLLLGFIRPSAGSGFCLGHDIVSQSIAIREQVGYVKGGERLYGYLSVQEIAKITGVFFNYWDEDLLNKYLTYLELSRRERVGKLSADRVTFLLMALALASNPRMLLLDEPFAGMKPNNKALLQRFIKDEALQSSGRTVLLATSSISDAAEFTVETGLLYRGSLLQIMHTAELRGNYPQDNFPADGGDEATFICQQYSAGEKKVDP